MEESNGFFPSSQDRKPASSSPQSNTKTSAYLQAMEFTVADGGLLVPPFHWILVLRTKKDDADWNAYAEAHFGGYREAVDTLTLSLPQGGHAYIWQDRTIASHTARHRRCAYSGVGMFSPCGA